MPRFRRLPSGGVVVNDFLSKRPEVYYRLDLVIISKRFFLQSDCKVLLSEFSRQARSTCLSLVCRVVDRLNMSQSHRGESLENKDEILGWESF